MRMRRPAHIPLLLVLVLVACRVAAQSDTFSVSFLTSDVNLNPLISYTTTEAQIYTAIYEGLVTYDPYSLDPLPALARRWEISEDGRTYLFSLRQAKYSNGDPVRASHFRETWLRLLDPEIDAPYASLLDVVEGARAYRTGESSDPSTVGINVLDDRTLEVVLETRAAHFLRILCHHTFVTVHPDMLGRETWSDDFVVSGPYVIDSMSQKTIELSRNTEYWDRRNVDIGSLLVHFSDDFDQVTAAFNAGEITWVRGAIDLGAIQRPDTLVVNPLFATSYYQFSAADRPFDDVRVRRALALLLPWDEIRNREYQYVPTDTLVPSIPFYPEVSGIGQDVAEARDLLEQAGFAGGGGFPDITITIPGGVENDRIAGLMRDAWEAELGISVEIETVLYPHYFDLVDDENFTVSTITWIGDFADPLTFLDMWTTDSNLNNSAYSNGEYDELVRRATGETGDTRYELLAQAEAMLLQDAIVLPISNSPSINLINLELIDGWYPNPLDVHPFKFLSFVSGGALPNVAFLTLELQQWQGFAAHVFDVSIMRRFQLGFIPLGGLEDLGLGLV